MKSISILSLVFASIETVFAAAPKSGVPSGCDPSVMSEAYWAIWNAEEQAKIDADIEANRKADAVIAVPVPAGSEVEFVQVGHDFRFGAHIFNFNQLGKKEYNDAYKASYGTGGLFNQATVAYYWNAYEPVPGRLRAGGDYEDTERFWNSLTREEAMDHPFWRRPAAGPVVEFLKSKDVRVHGHILIWGLAKPYWIYDWYCPEAEKRAFDNLGIPRHSAVVGDGESWIGGYNCAWRDAWAKAYPYSSETEIAAMAPTFTREMRRIFRKRVFDVAEAFGTVNDSWDVVNESSLDWASYKKSRTGLPVWKSVYGLMPGDYPLHALLDAKEAFPANVKLAINDYNIVDDFQSQVRDLENEGAKIDIVGCQMHIFNTNDCARLALGETNINWVGTPQKIQATLDLMAELGRPIHVSEITITSPGADEKSRQIQAILTRNIYRKWFSHKAMMGITWWNTVDGGGVKGEPLVSGLFTADMKKKPAYEALDELINHEWHTSGKAKAEGGDGNRGVIRFRGFRGAYRISWTCLRCKLRHSRIVQLDGDGIHETAASAPESGCMPPIRNYTVDGKDVELPLGVDLLDIKKIYPSEVRQGCDGTRWADVSFKVTAPKAGEYWFDRVNDYYGVLYVNGKKIGNADGSWRVFNPTPTRVELEKGENVIMLKTRAGSGGAWHVGFKPARGSTLKY